ncbi:hypothetical protein ACFO5R_17595 [Halosolutus amylolyticus]|uniref:Uncharacterized protein n=1 Tax=Halosolutus amylolyticus TaxID=2932267 RepID=A0ABD5PTU4_9EURY|nr:hypothetical protein [Halosolutus amylolyticus]
MSENLSERVDELLTEADAASGAALSRGGEDSGDPSIGETAREASEIVDSADPQDLLAAVGLDTLPDGSEPDTIPDAIARGDPERVADLERVLHLANLADRTGDGELDDAVGSLREAIESGDGTGESSKSEAGDESSDEAEAEAESEGEPGPGDEDTDDLEDRIRSTLSDRVADFGDDVSSLQEQLEAAVGEASSDETDEAATADDEVEETTAEAEEPADAESADENGLLGTDEDGLLGADQGLRSGSSESSRHSTMAPPPSERADMRAVRRHSTMPKKN